MTKFMTRFAKDESGATAIEYGLIVALIAVVIITAVSTLVSISLPATVWHRVLHTMRHLLQTPCGFATRRGRANYPSCLTMVKLVRWKPR